MFLRPAVDKYSTEPLHKIFKDESRDGFFKRISEYETLLAIKLKTHTPEVWRITRSHETIVGILMRNQLLTRYNESPVSGSERQAFLDELSIKFNESRSAAAFQRATPGLPAELGKKIGSFLSPSDAPVMEHVNKATKKAEPPPPRSAKL